MTIMYAYFILMNVNIKDLQVLMSMDIWSKCAHVEDRTTFCVSLYWSLPPFLNLELAAPDTLLVGPVLGIPELQAAVRAFWHLNLRSSSLELQPHDQLSHLSNLQFYAHILL